MHSKIPGSRPFFLLATLLTCAATVPLAAQGRTDYFNVESPQVKPITVARVGGHDWLLVCNTPDNSVEVWDTNESLSPDQRFKLRVRVGLEPVSVAFNDENQRVYTADFLSDSVSMFSLVFDASGLWFRPVATTYVGDEPVGLAFSENWDDLFVTHATPGTFDWRDALTLVPKNLPPKMEGVDLVDSDTSPTKALKEPRAVLVRNNTMFVLGFKGGNANATGIGFSPYDFDLYSRELGTQTLSQIGGLGTTNFNMTFDGNNDLWVVGAEARNLEVNSERDARVAATGFVKSTIYRVSGLFTGTPTSLALDLNGTDASGQHAVGAGLGLAQPTDVLAYAPPVGAQKIYFTAFGSDRLGVLTPTSSTDPYTWPLARITIPVAVPALPALPNPMAGPRGLAQKHVNLGDTGDAGERIYVMNRLDDSFSIVNPATDVCLATIGLRHDPTPKYVRDGRQFLYSAQHSARGFVSCASCHMDGRTDSLRWKIGTPNLAIPLPYPVGLVDGIAPPSPLEFFKDKGAMITQSLQGLLDFEVDPEVQAFFTNAPYHWRGDKVDFLGFNGAFVNLMGQADPDGDGKGLSDGEMETYRTFVNSIHYPPNPEELPTRVYSTTTDPNAPDAQNGLSVFHQRALGLCDGRSCVECHALPEGSNNHTTVPTPRDAIETPGLRSLKQREARLEKGPLLLPSTIVTGNSGLTHAGDFVSLNHFLNRFSVNFAGASDVLLDVKLFVREFDVGTAPLVGRPYTATSTPSSETGPTLDLFEAQAQVANVGVAVVARIGGLDSGYWLDVSQSPLEYQLEGGSTRLTRAELLALLVGSRDRLVFFATPLGSERRIASVTGTSTVLTGSTPTGLLLRPCPTNSANAPVPTFRDNWDPFPMGIPLPLPFSWTGASADFPHFLKTIRVFQHGLAGDMGGAYGLTQLRHEAPRRFAVAGFGILPGATLELLSPNSSVAPLVGGAFDQVPTIEFRLPLHPTSEVLLDGRRVWQTAAEVEPLVLYELMLGGPKAMGVPEALDPTIVMTIDEQNYTSNHFNPLANLHYVRVQNPDGLSSSLGNGGWQPLTLQ